ncbi:hypothetical protein SAY86_020333 [Trapa natans]|uniref:Uncharacterized protein n=1 Tax=Trapa natans TaxID=22666 RepID=A0AAN7LQE3_TRANT|nr:hypothetical protein SAY86_020333 [Trapa natans]
MEKGSKGGQFRPEVYPFRRLGPGISDLCLKNCPKGPGQGLDCSGAGQGISEQEKEDLYAGGLLVCWDLQGAEEACEGSAPLCSASGGGSCTGTEVEGDWRGNLPGAMVFGDYVMEGVSSDLVDRMED